MPDIIVSSVDLASYFKNFISNNPSIKFSNSELKNLIIDSENNTLLKVKRKLGSIEIISVEVITDDIIISELNQTE